MLVNNIIIGFSLNLILFMKLKNPYAAIISIIGNITTALFILGTSSVVIAAVIGAIKIQTKGIL